MSTMKGLTQRIAGKTKQAVCEIIGDQDLHEQGKLEVERGRNDSEKVPPAAKKPAQST
ncbi:CsbD family protein [Bradyrhizobium sp. 1]|nr:CsbD family protein [Bradyrhizobium sp. 1]